jgi:predicted CXXCH cytochrome family protein
MNRSKPSMMRAGDASAGGIGQLARPRLAWAKSRSYRRFLAAFACTMAGVLLAVFSPASADESIVNSKHDLSVRGPGPIRAVTENEVCIFCHAPHNAAPQTPLWNRANPDTYYRIYESSTTDARIDQPSGPSKMCLSCHDGSMALGNVLSRPETHPIVMTARTIPPGTTDLTNDLSDDHPIGFRYDRALSNADPQIRPPEVVTRDLPLGAHGEMHCTTCHDPHNNQLGDFLRITDQYSAICITCHDMHGWDHASHAVSRKRTPERVVDPGERLKYHTVADNGCLNCHKIHSAPQRERLLRHKHGEDGCLNCHSGTVASFNIAAEIGKQSGHDGRWYAGAHDPAENPFTMRRHVECVDCHNPHASFADPIGTISGSFGQTVKGPNVHVSGVTITGRQTDNSQFLYEICFKCHADGISRPRAGLASNRWTSPLRRDVAQTNTRLQFQTSNPSFHPVAGPRRNQDVVSLIPPWRVGSTMTCTDCHNSDNARSMGGTGADGPHGSIYEPLLVRNYETRDFTVESADAYSLCYECHSRDSILNDESFPLHRRHIVDARTPCSVCHDAHGVYRGHGSSVNHSSLINFDLSVVQSAVTPTGRRVEFIDTGRFAGSCTLTCHGVAHINFDYANTAGGAIKGPLGSR